MWIRRNVTDALAGQSHDNNEFETNSIQFLCMRV